MGVPIDRNDRVVQMLLDSIVRDEQRSYNRIEALHLDMMSCEGLVVVDNSRVCGWRVVDQAAGSTDDSWCISDKKLTSAISNVCRHLAEAPRTCNGENLSRWHTCNLTMTCAHYDKQAYLSMYDTGTDADGKPLMDESDCINFQERA